MDISLPDSYATHDYWRRYLPFLPEVTRLPRDPEEERWVWQGTSVHLDRLDGEKELVMLKGCGHLPYEAPGAFQLREALGRFLDRVEGSAGTRRIQKRSK